MKIKVNTVTDKGLDCLEIYEPDRLELGTEELKFLEPLQAGYHITKEREDLFVKVGLKSRMGAVCVRCLDNLEYPWEKGYSFHYRVKDTDTVDITEDLREEIILDYPLKPLCKEDCLGLCPKCGQNLNKGKCNCQMKPSLTSLDCQG
jgi:uncharacterized protein